MYRLLALSANFCKVAPKYSFKFGWNILPHPEKAYKGGEDALFASKDVLFVADGVGGWAESGVDPGLYSKKLASLVEEMTSKWENKDDFLSNPKKLMKDAVQLNLQTGSSTACLLTLDKLTGSLQSYYLGDSVFGIFDTESSKCRLAQQQQIQFNFPVQIGTNGNDPSQGVYHKFNIDQFNNNEVIVVASDGLWDNMEVQEIMKVVSNNQLSYTEMAKQLAQTARNRGEMRFESPFYKKAKEAGLNYPPQGKLDDNAVIVAKIVKDL